MPEIASTIYDEGQRPWRQSINDLVDYKRAFTAGGGEQKKIAQAMISQNPVLPRQEIQQNMTAISTPPRFGYDYSELTVSAILQGQYLSEADEWDNFSGSSGEINSTERPGIFW